MKSRMTIFVVFFMLMTVVLTTLLIGKEAFASGEYVVFLPSMMQSDTSEPIRDVHTGLITTVPLSDNTLLVLMLEGEGTNFTTYIYDGYNMLVRPVEGWEVTGPIARIDVVGCLWVTSESSEGYLTVHKVNGISEDVTCLER